MKLFRLRFIILGLLLCVFHVWCRTTCGTDLTDPASSAYLAGVVVEGRVAQTLPPDHSDQFNVTIRINSVYKGVPSSKKRKLVTIGKFGQESDEANCIYTSIRRGSTRFVFFLKESSERNYYTLTAFPVKFTKKIGRQIRKILCKKGTCGKPPTLRKIKVRKYKTGRPILLRCRIRSSKPDAVFSWLKDGQEIQSRRVRIKSSKRGSRLKINKANAGDGGTYTCKATNVLGSTEALAKVKVLPSKPKPTRKTTRGPTTDVVSHPPAFVACGPEKAGYCLNSGECRVIVSMNVTKCHCRDTYRGARCEERIQHLPDRKLIEGGKDPQAHEKDRTVTIIGIVIGILIFVCICIASYFLAKKRRDQFLQRQEEKKRKNSKLDSQVYIPPSYRLLNSMDDVDGGTAPKIKTLPPSLKEHMHMETQTDETSFMPVNPNTNMRLHSNPLNRFPQHIPPAQTNSRNRLSAVSVDGKQPNSRASTGSGIHPLTPGDPRPSNSPSIPQDAKPKAIPIDPPPPSYKNCVPTAIPVLRMDSVGGASSEEEDPQNTEALIPLHISEGEDDRSSHSPVYGSTPFPHQKKFFSSLGKAAPASRQIDTKAEIPIYVNANGVGSQSSLTSSDSSTTGSADSEVSAVYNYPLYNPQSKDYPDSISWNERGSPEHVIADKDCPILPGVKKPQVDYVDKSYLPPTNKKVPRAVYHDMNLEKKNKLRNVVVSEPSVPV